MTDFEVRFGADPRWSRWRGTPPIIVTNAIEALQAIGAVK